MAVYGTKQNPLRFSFVNVFEPKIPQGGTDPKFSVQVCVPKTATDVLEKIRAGIEAARKDGVEKKFFGEKASLNPQDSGVRMALRDGDKEADNSDDGKREYLRGHFFFSAVCDASRPPAVVGPNLERVMNKEDIYSGIFGAIEGNFYAFKTGKGGVAFGLNSLMKLRDGDRLDGRVTADVAFAELKASDGDELF